MRNNRVLALGAVLCVLTAITAAQGVRPQDGDGLQQLIAEVRGLRVATERMAASAPRVQLALGRLQLQEQRIDTLQRRLDIIRDQMRAASLGATPLQKTEEGFLVQQIAAEQGRWQQINQTLEALESEFGRR